MYDQLVPHRMIKREVENELLQNPIRVKGMGLSEEFHELFDKKKVEIIPYQHTKKAMQ
jgi:hypothetical protein